MISEQKKQTIAIIKQIQMNQEDLPDNYPILPCPRCGGEMERKTAHNALSRRADIYICSICGTDEAIMDFKRREDKVEDWAIFSGGEEG